MLHNQSNRVSSQLKRKSQHIEMAGKSIIVIVLLRLCSGYYLVVPTMRVWLAGGFLHVRRIPTMSSFTLFDAKVAVVYLKKHFSLKRRESNQSVLPQ